MANAETNPVLQVIDNTQPLEENKKYPAGLLDFNQTGWQAYYHCHPASRAGNHRFEGEHGHFHIFVRIQHSPEKWSHLVALAIDPLGQPLGWFTVNHWVTAEEWLNADNLINHLQNIPFAKQDTLTERWLLSLLAASYKDVAQTLISRDQHLQKYQQQQPEADSKQDRDIYLLSEMAIDLMALIEPEI